MMTFRCLLIAACLASSVLAAAGAVPLAPVFYRRQGTWWETLRASRAAFAQSAPTADPNLTEGGKQQWDSFWRLLASDYPDCTAENLSRSLETATARSESPAAREIHVAVDGSDSNDGSRTSPLQTLRRARDLIRERRRAGFRGPVAVIVHAGTYLLSEPLQLGAEDSGSKGQPVSYRAAAGEEVLLSGGIPLHGSWQPYRSGVWQLDLGADPGLSAPLRSRQLFVNGRRAILARYPNAGSVDATDQGWLRVRREPTGFLLAGLATPGDWVAYAFEVARAGEYGLIIGLATEVSNPAQLLEMAVDGRPIPVESLARSGDWRQVAYARAANVTLKPGHHTLRLQLRRRPEAGNFVKERVHLAGVLVTDNARLSRFDGLPPAPAPNESRVFIDASDRAKRIGGFSQTGFSTITLYDATGAETPRSFRTEPGAIHAAWAQETQGEVFMFPGPGWFSTITHLTRALPAAGDVFGRLEISGREAGTPIYPGNRFYVFNLLSELDAPGEWYLDYRRQRLYYYPRPGEDLATAQIIAPRLIRLIEIAAPSTDAGLVHDIEIRGFAFAHTDYTADQPDLRSSEDCAVLLENAWNCSVEDCHFHHLGGYGIRLSLDSCLNRISGNTIEDSGAGGIMLRGPWVGRDKVTFASGPVAGTAYPIGNLIADNDIHDGGVFKKYIAGVDFDARPECDQWAPGNVISHNHIHHMPRNGVFGFFNNGGYVIEHNWIHDVLRESDDGGLVHICTSAHERTSPALIRNNLLYDAHGYRWDDAWYGRRGLEAEALAIGVYLDDYTSGVTVENNVIANTRRGCVYIHDGRNNLVRNNILLNDRRYQLLLTETWRGNRFRNNLSAWTTDQPYYAQVAIQSKPTAEEAAGFDYNLLWHAGRPIEIELQGSWREWQARGLDRHSAVADPAFEELDLDRKICRLRADSPALALGFRPIDLSDAGPRANRLPR